MNKVSDFVVLMEALSKCLYQIISILLDDITQKHYDIHKKIEIMRNILSISTKDKLVASEFDDKPPKFAQYLLYLFINRENREALLGDLEEEYWVVYNKFGLKKARIFYRWQVFKSIWPLISAFVGKILKLFIKGIVENFSVSK